MTKKEFLHRMETEKISLREYSVLVDAISEGQYIIGCYYEDGAWNIYKTGERGGHYIIKSLKNENEAFDYLYELVKLQESYIKKYY